MKQKFEIDEREIKDIKKLLEDVVWLLWFLQIESNEKNQ